MGGSCKIDEESFLSSSFSFYETVLSLIYTMEEG